MIRLVVTLIFAFSALSAPASDGALYDSCMKYKPNKKYCECISQEMSKAKGISKETILRLEKKFTVNVNEAPSKPDGSTVAQSESEPLLGPYVTCLNRIVGKK